MQVTTCRPLLGVMLFMAPLAGFWTCGSRQSIESRQIPDEQLAMLRKEVREMVRPGCGSCHTSSLPTAKPAAVAVFDLAREDWSATMTPEHLKGFEGRSRDFHDPAKAKVDQLIAAEMVKWGGKGEGQETGDPPAPKEGFLPD